MIYNLTLVIVSLFKLACLSSYLTLEQVRLGQQSVTSRADEKLQQTMTLTGKRLDIYKRVRGAILISYKSLIHVAIKSMTRRDVTFRSSRCSTTR